MKIVEKLASADGVREGYEVSIGETNSGAFAGIVCKVYPFATLVIYTTGQKLNKINAKIAALKHLDTV